MSYIATISGGYGYTPTVNSATVNYGTFLQPGQTASYPSSIFTEQNYRNSGDGLPAGAIAGIVVGSVAGALLVAFLIFVLVLHRRKQAKKAKRDSQRQLLPTSQSLQSYTNRGSTPEMQQRGAAASATTAAGAGGAAHRLQQPAAIVPPSSQRKTGFTFGRGHRRSESASSTTPFLPGSPTSGYSGRSSASFDYPRPSTDSPYNGRNSTLYGGTPLTAHSEAFPDNPIRESIDETPELHQK